jgi:predicted acylesterase/phospholipase RssA
MNGLARMARLTLVALAAVLAACTTLTRLGAVPSELQDEARPDGISDVRFYPQQLANSAARSQVRIRWPASGVEAEIPVSSDTSAGCDMLAISAGGDRGAFAAGLLSGWSQTGTRPHFKVVTGVSVGALIAPFAFLGPRYDHVLREVALSAGRESFFHRRSFLSGLLGDGFASSEPLERVLATYVTAAVLREIADEYRHGRDLYILTTDLDAGVPVIWNMGAIAASDSPDALILFRQVLRASTAVPVAVSPVLIPVTAGGRHFQELHVDGSVTHQVFLGGFPLPQLRVSDMQASAPSCGAFIIINAQMDSSRSTTPRRTLRIGERSIQTLMQIEASNDVASIFTALQRQDIQFNLAYIDSDFQAPHRHDFDPSYLRTLFTYGERLGSGAYPWHSAPPRAQPSNRSASVNPRETLLLRCADCSNVK